MAEVKDSVKKKGEVKEEKAEEAVESKSTSAQDKVLKKTKKKTISKKDKKRSKKYLETASEFDRNKKYSLKEAVELAKKTSYSKFDGTITLDIRLSRSKSDESIRGTVKLPHGIDKKIKVAVASDDLIEKVKGGTVDFDVLLATPQMMPKLAQVAKILGPRGLMPNPKDGTVVEDVEKAEKELSEMARYRADSQRNIHIAVGKVSWDGKKIIENVEAALKALAKYKKDTVVLSPTMGVGVRVEV